MNLLRNRAPRFGGTWLGLNLPIALVIAQTACARRDTQAGWQNLTAAGQVVCIVVSAWVLAARSFLDATPIVFSQLGLPPGTPNRLLWIVFIAAMRFRTCLSVMDPVSSVPGEVSQP